MTYSRTVIVVGPLPGDLSAVSLDADSRLPLVVPTAPNARKGGAVPDGRIGAESGMSALGVRDAKAVVAVSVTVPKRTHYGHLLEASAHTSACAAKAR